MKTNKNYNRIKKTVKYLLTLNLVLTFFFFGCDQGSDITSPENTPNLMDQKDYYPSDLIKLPAGQPGSSDENTLSVTKTLNGNAGGEIKLNGSYVAVDGDTVKVDIKLTVREYSFTGNVDLTITVDDEFAAASFFPAMVFDKPLELKMKFDGIDLESGDYDFVFIGDDGTIESVEYNNLHVNEDKGLIWVNKAFLNHFSRYGFVN